MKPLEEYWKLVESERHFNSIQAGIRNRASTWILAAFAAIAVLIQVSEKVTWLVPGTILIGMVSLMATVGLLLLWINDQVVYQRLLRSVFMIGLKLEYDNPEMPPIRMLMMYSSAGKGMSRWMTLYYTIPMVAFLVISIFVTLLREQIGVSSSALTPENTFWILVGICILQAGLSIWVQHRKSKLSTKEIAANFGDEGFTALFSGQNDSLPRFKEVIERYQSKKMESTGEKPIELS